MVIDDPGIPGSTPKGLNMVKKTFIIAGVTAAALATGGVAVAATGGGHGTDLSVGALSTSAVPTGSAATPSTTTPSTTSPASPSKTGKHGGKDKHGGKGKHGDRMHGAKLGTALHGTWVTKDGKTGALVTHDAIRGTASAVSATSITVTAADKVSQTYAVNSKTKIRTFDATTHKPAKSSISAVHSGATVVVIGAGTSKLTATGVLVGMKK